MAFVSYLLSHCGHVYAHNEDASYRDDAKGRWIVADGMGGHAAGDVASKLAAATVTASLDEGANGHQAILQAHETIKQQAEAMPEHAGMATTIVLAQIHNKQLSLHWAGDSRAYLLDKRGRLRQLTRDHSFVQDMVLRGVFTEEEARQDPRRNLVRRVLGREGVEAFAPEQKTMSLKGSGRILLCTDGVHDALEHSQIEACFATGTPDSQLAALQAAILSGAAQDNFSALLIHYDLRWWRGFPG